MIIQQSISFCRTSRYPLEVVQPARRPSFAHGSVRALSATTAPATTKPVESDVATTRGEFATTAQHRELLASPETVTRDEN